MPDVYYAVRTGRRPGVYLTWTECEAQIKSFSNPKFKKFTDEAEAEAFVNGTISVKLKVYEGEDCDVVFCDGACRRNGSKGSVAGIGVWWGKDDPRNISERCPGAQTNNRAELVAIVRVLETAPINPKTLLIKTDSQYCVQCFQDWIEVWKRNGWQTAIGAPVKNVEVIRYINACIAARKQKGQKVVFEHVKGHSGVEGNDAADALATQGTSMPPLPERDWDTLRLGCSLEDEPVLSTPSLESSPPPVLGFPKESSSKTPPAKTSKVLSPVHSIPSPSGKGKKAVVPPAKGPRGMKRSYEIEFGSEATVEEVDLRGSKVVVKLRPIDEGVMPVKITQMVTQTIEVPLAAPPTVVTQAVDPDEVDMNLYQDISSDDDFED